MDMPLRELGDTCTGFIDLERLRYLPGHRDEELLEHLDGKASIARVPQASDEGLRPIPFRAAGRIMGVDQYVGVDEDVVTAHPCVDDSLGKPRSCKSSLLHLGRPPVPRSGAESRAARWRSRARAYPESRSRISLSISESSRDTDTPRWAARIFARRTSSAASESVRFTKNSVARELVRLGGDLHLRRPHPGRCGYCSTTSRTINPIAIRAMIPATTHHQSNPEAGSGSGSGSGSNTMIGSGSGAGSGISTGCRASAQRTQISAAGEFGSAQCGQINDAVAARPTVPGSRRNDAPDSSPSGVITVPFAQNSGKSQLRQKSSADRLAMFTVASWPHSGQLTTSVAPAVRWSGIDAAGGG